MTAIWGIFRQTVTSTEALGPKLLHCSVQKRYQLSVGPLDRLKLTKLSADQLSLVLGLAKRIQISANKIKATLNLPSLTSLQNLADHYINKGYTAEIIPNQLIPRFRAQAVSLADNIIRFKNLISSDVIFVNDDELPSINKPH